MKCLQSFFITVAAFLAAQSLRAGDLKVIANPSVGASAISAAELQGVFLITKTSLGDGSRVRPILLKGGPVHDAFVKTYLHKTDAALSAYYRNLVFTGKGTMPDALASDADVVEYVSKTKGSIGYVSSGTSTAGVKTLEVK